MTWHGHEGVAEKGSDQNGGREIFVYHVKSGGEWHTHSVNLARAKYENKTGKDLSKDQQVDHKDSNHSNDSQSNLQVLSKHDNVAKEDKRRAGRQFNK